MISRTVQFGVEEVVDVDVQLIFFCFFLPSFLPSSIIDANPHKDTTAHFTLLNRAYEVLTNPRLKQRYDRYGRRGIGTSAASDVIHANGIAPTQQRKSYPAYQVAQSDSADVCWKGSGTSKRVDMLPKRSQQTLFQSMNKNLIPPTAAPIRSRKPMRDLYSILGLQRQAKDDEIWHAYNSLKDQFDPGTIIYRKFYFHTITMTSHKFS